MNLVEQAVFTSAETSRTAGYQLVAKSCGISEEDSRALSTWGPSHGSLMKSGRQAQSINFHPLPSGHFCVSRTTASGNEYSGRGTRIYTQCLVVSAETLRQFANSPFAVVRAACGSGLLKQYEKVPATLQAVPLIGRAPTVDPSLLSRSRREFGPEQVACLVQAALGCESMAIAGAPSGESAIAVLLNCLPPQIRPEFSFSTGLRTSARRPFRWLTLDDDVEERHRARQIDALTFFDFSDDPTSHFPATDGWARAILEVLATGRTSLLSRWFENHSSELSLDQLNAMGLELLAELAKDTVSQTGVSLSTTNAPPPRSEEAISDDDAAEGAPKVVSPSESQATRQLAHAAHPRFSGTSAAEARIPGPSGKLASEPSQVVARLESLDDLVYDAIKGDASSLTQLRSAWPHVKAELGDELVGQSREQYLHYALQVWEQCVEATGVRPTDRAVNALEVLCLLFDEA